MKCKRKISKDYCIHLTLSCENHRVTSEPLSTVKIKIFIPIRLKKKKIMYIFLNFTLKIYFKNTINPKQLRLFLFLLFKNAIVKIRRRLSRTIDIVKNNNRDRFVRFVPKFYNQDILQSIVSARKLKQQLQNLMIIPTGNLIVVTYDCLIILQSKNFLPIEIRR